MPLRLRTCTTISGAAVRVVGAGGAPSVRETSSRVLYVALDRLSGSTCCSSALPARVYSEVVDRSAKSRSSALMVFLPLYGGAAVWVICCGEEQRDGAQTISRVRCASR